MSSNNDLVDSSKPTKTISTDNKINDCENDSGIPFDLLYFLSHIVMASILVVCLKKTQPLILTIILSGILGFVSYTEQSILPIYTLPIYGTAIYLLDFIIMTSYLPENINKTTFDLFYQTMWKLPYFGIISYYIIMLTDFKIN